MLGNYLKIALRNLRRQPGYSLINVTGLAVGIAVSLLLVLFIQHEVGYDQFFPDAERMYRVTTERTFGGNTQHHAKAPDPVAPALQRSFPSVEDVTGFNRFWESMVSYENRRFYEDKMLLVDSTFLDVFSFPLTYGDRRTALDDPSSVVLTTETAQRYFGEENPVGKMLVWGSSRELRVTGVLAPLPSNTHLDFDLLVRRGGRQGGGSWYATSTWTYLRLREGHTPEQLETQLDSYVQEHAGPERADNIDLSLQPVTNIHLYSNLRGEIQPNSDVRYLYIFGFIAGLILLIACINYINLSTARFTRRAREVGVRKVVGAGRRQLIRQFLTETLLYTGLSAAVGLGLTAFLPELLRRFLGRQLPLAPLGTSTLVLAFVAIVIGASLLAGSYPGFVLSRFQPAEVLKDHLQGLAAGATLRKALMTFQFAVAIGLIATTLVVQDQLQFLQDKRLGFDQEQVLVVHDYSFALRGQFDAFKEELTQHTAVEHVSGGSIPGETHGGTYIFNKQEDSVLFHRLGGGFNYVETLGFEIARGRSFSRDHPSDSSGLLLNETAVRELGLDDPIGTRFDRGGLEGTVVGVVNDFHLLSLYEQIPPLYIRFSEGGSRSFLVRSAPGQIEPALSHLRKTWNRMAGDRPLEYTFLDDRFEQFYQAEQHLARIFWVFALVAIFVACLGLVGLTAYTADRRTKEIGIRKVLGATAASIVVLLSKDFLKLIGAALLVAGPVTYLVMRRWLENYAYRISLGVEIFLMAGTLVVGIALVTISYQSLKAALTNPTDSLRYE